MRARHGDDAVRAEDASGRRALLAFGERGVLEREMNAVRAIAERAPVAPVLGVEEDDVHGAYLVLEDAPAIAAVDPADRASEAPGALRLLASVLEIARALEQVGFSWSPRERDLEVDGGRLRALRIRGATRLGPGERLDARSALSIVGPSLLDDGPPSPEVLRLVLPSRAPRGRTIEELETALAEARSDLERGSHELATFTDVGRERDRNEDAVRVAVVDDARVAVVCDGVSAASHAQTASRVAAETILAHLSMPENLADPRQAIADSIAIADDELWHLHRARHGLPLGTTAIAAVVRGARVSVGWVGDSRGYLVAADAARVVTRDHSWLSEALDAGTPLEDALRSPWAHALTRCLGALDGGDAWHARPEVVDLTVDRPSLLILCTDGLWNYADDAARVRDIVLPYLDDAHAAARALVAHALLSGGQDNVTVAIVACGREAPPRTV